MLKSPAQSLHLKYPISSTWEFTLNDSEVIKGEIYCTDPVAAIVVVKDQLGDVSLISVASIQESKQVNEASSDQVKMAAENMTHTKKVLEEREKRAIRLAQESLKRLNPKVSEKIKVDSIPCSWSSLCWYILVNLGITKRSNCVWSPLQGM